MSRAAATVTKAMFHGLSRLGRLHPKARPSRHGVTVDTDLAYGPDPAHRLDLYRPRRPGPWPVVFYVHGGGFHMLSKDTHWLMGLAFARAGYLVVNISYRLAPTHRYPAAIEDTCRAWLETLAKLPAWGGDPTRIAVAGESAGGNLITALTLATCQPRPEPFARAVYDAGVVPRAALPFCALLEVSRPERFGARRPLPGWIQGMVARVSTSYLGDAPTGEHRDLADPLVVLEGGAALARPLPPWFAPVGTADPILDDTRRLEKALAARGVPCEARYYPGGVHAFHAFVWQAQARQCWRDALAFLARHLR
ncbi:MAG: alpha/beta hydrolase [Kofleriaceae bacterium]|jgi:acetyl esterase|nr:alpha/beta hydrolase [Kofleriaceae bacterium]MBP9170861.1 alpha/beta hydrolase [Kofleriaceae bacterium]MBP9857624.1 alpha/beta hydrolase [Kofleriaceae bacterium]